MDGPILSLSKNLPALDLIRFFETKAALVVAAVVSLESLPSELARLNAALLAYDRASVAARLAAIDALVKRAEVGGDNLLVLKSVTPPDPFVLCAVSRQASGAIEVKTIELDRDALALSGPARAGQARPLNHMTAATKALATDPSPAASKCAAAAIEALATQIRRAISRLSLVKARLDLQQSFLSSSTEANPVAASPIRADSHLNLSGARDMALEAQRLLSARSLNIGTGTAPDRSTTAPAAKKAAAVG